MRIMIDTNVLLSAIIFGSHTVVATILTASSGGNTLLLSTRSLEEARAVVTRKWPARIHALDEYLHQLDYETIVTPENPTPGLFDIRDPLDYPILYSAIAGHADVFVTGDRDFEDVSIDDIAIVTPAEFVGKQFGR